MTTPQIPSASLLLTLTVLTVVLVTGCVNAGSASPQVGFLDDAEGADSGNRTSCAEIFGTAFRSDEERDWFRSNCSRWPLVNVPGSKPAPSSISNASLPRECNDMRGRPYQSDDQRRWYLDNCLLGNDSIGNTAESQPQSGDRTNCNEIRGTPYRSNAERDWYLRNCSGQATTNSSSPAVTRGTLIVPSNNNDDDRGNNRSRGRD